MLLRFSDLYNYANVKVFSFRSKTWENKKLFWLLYLGSKIYFGKEGLQNSTSNFFGPLVYYLAGGMGVVSLWSYSTRSAAYGKMARE